MENKEIIDRITYKNELKKMVKAFYKWKKNYDIDIVQDSIFGMEIKLWEDFPINYRVHCKIDGYKFIEYFFAGKMDRSSDYSKEWEEFINKSDWIDKNIVKHFNIKRLKEVLDCTNKELNSLTDSDNKCQQNILEAEKIILENKRRLGENAVARKNLTVKKEISEIQLDKLLSKDVDKSWTCPSTKNLKEYEGRIG